MAASSSEIGDQQGGGELPSSNLGGDAIQPGILLVDDDSFALALQSRMLRTMGYQRVFTAASGKAALQHLQDDPQSVDVIVCDIKMPSMDGIEFLQIVNAGSFRGAVILLSGEGVRIMHTVQKLLGSGRLVILGALEKPARRAPLRALLEAWTPRSTTAASVQSVRTYDSEELHVAQRELQWVLHYQPKVHLRTGALVGVEALVRWKHPEDDLIFPASFIGGAEECGAIDALTEWVLQEALGQQADWQAQGLEVQMAVNVSLESLQGPDFVQRIAGFAQAVGVSPRAVVLEISESRLMSLEALPLESLVRLRLQGFGLSIDDFGTGHSSLTQLRDVPFTELKVDLGFVHGARHNQIVRPILEGSIGIGKRMGMQSVAEGVESEEDWHLLRSIGCDFAQGYFIGKPMAAEQVAPWLADWQKRCPRLVGK